MTILCIETATNVCSAALSHDGTIVDERIALEGANHAQRLPVFVDELLAIARQQGLAVQSIALSRGAGSYTGLRIGASMAKGLCYGLNVPLLAISTPQILCAGVDTASLPKDAVLYPMIDARRMEVYTEPYDVQLHSLAPMQACVITGAESLPLTADHAYYFGDGAAKCKALLQEPQWTLIPDIIPLARNMVPLAEQAYAEGRAITDVAYFEPDYLKDFIAAPSHVKGLK